MTDTSPTDTSSGTRSSSNVLGFPAPYPAFIAIAYVLSKHDAFAPLEVLARPALVAVVVVLAAQLIATLLFRNRDQAALAIGLVVLAGIDPGAALLMLGAATAPLILGLARTRRVVALPWPRLTTFFSVVATVGLLMNTTPIITGGVIVSIGPAAPVDADIAREGAPDIYLIMLDAYPRADTLLSEFSFDNSTFLNGMKDEGFVVSAKAHTNYNMTLLTLASMLNSAHIGELMPNPPSPGLQSVDLVQSINDAKMLRELRSQGYEVVAIPSGVSSMVMYGADRFLDSGQINSYELSLLNQGEIPNLLPDVQESFAYDQQRERFHATFRTLKELGRESVPHPRFVFAHVMSPHPPILFNADGSPRNGWGCYPETCDFWVQLYDQDVRGPLVGQLTYLNKMVLDATREIISQSTRPPVIVVFSDHGYRSDLDDRSEMLQSLFLSHTPGHPGIFPDDATPINILPRILNAYADSDVELQPRSAFVVDLRTVPAEGYFPLQPWLP